MNEQARIPWLSVGLIGLNIAAAFTLFFNPDMALSAGFRASSPSFITAISSLFLHFNVIHLLGNMVFLAAVGPLVELAAGPLRFAVIYLAAGLAGVGGHWLMTPALDRDRPLIGASAAIAGCIGYTVIRYINVRVPILPKCSVPVWSLALVWIGLQATGGFLRIGEDSGGTAYWSHLAGFLVGLALALVFRAPQEQSLIAAHDKLNEMNTRSPAASLRAAERVLEQDPDDLSALRAKATAHHAMHDRGHEIETLLRMLEIAPSEEHPDLIHELIHAGGIETLSPQRRARLSDKLSTQDDDLAILLLQSIVDMDDAESQRPDAMLRLAQLVHEKDGVRSSSLLDELAAKYPFHGATQVAKAKGLIP